LNIKYSLTNTAIRHGIYEQELNKLFRADIEDMAYLFLTPNGRQALNPAFESISYEQLVSALKNVDVNFITDIRKAVLYNEMIFHLGGIFWTIKNSIIQ